MTRPPQSIDGSRFVGDALPAPAVIVARIAGMALDDRQASELYRFSKSELIKHDEQGTP